MNKLDALREALCKQWGCGPEELTGRTVADLLHDAEQDAGTVIYWGLWTSDELKAVL